MVGLALCGGLGLLRRGDNLAFEKRWEGVEPRPFLQDGTTSGVVFLDDCRGFYVKMRVSVKSNSQQPRRLQVKRVFPDRIVLGPENGNIDKLADISDFLVADGATVEAGTQERIRIGPADRAAAIYAQEPVVADRNVLVDEFGRYYNIDNPIATKLVGASAIGLEVNLTDQETPDRPADAVRIGDGDNRLEINPDGSINVISTDLPVNSYSILNQPLPDADTRYEISVPDGCRRFDIKTRNAQAGLRIYETMISSSFLAVARGAVYQSGAIRSDNLKIFVESDRPGAIIEAIFWFA